MNESHVFVDDDDNNNKWKLRNQRLPFCAKILLFLSVKQPNSKSISKAYTWNKNSNRKQGEQILSTDFVEIAGGSNFQSRQCPCEISADVWLALRVECFCAEIYFFSFFRGMNESRPKNSPIPSFRSGTQQVFVIFLFFSGQTQKPSRGISFLRPV